jgi:hypothetical protein
MGLGRKKFIDFPNPSTKFVSLIFPFPFFRLERLLLERRRHSSRKDGRRIAPLVADAPPDSEQRQPRRDRGSGRRDVGIVHVFIPLHFFAFLIIYLF